VSRTRIIALLLVLGTLLLYLPVCHYPFIVYDDGDYVTHNRVVQNGLTWSGVAWAFTTWHAANWHPLTWLSLMADYQFFGPDAGAFHAGNALFHTINSVLLLLLLLRWTKALWPSAAAAALFAWHPMHVESVAWISERKDVLSTFFALLTLLAYTKAASKMSNDECRMESRRLAGHSSFVIRHSGYWLALVWFALGLMAKPMLVTLPFVLLLLDYWPLGRIRNSEFGLRAFAKLFPEKIPFFALSAASCVVTFLAQHQGGAVATLQHVPISYRLENVPVAYVTYLFKLFWPARLAVFYPMPDKLSPLTVAAAVLVLLFISAAVWFGRKRGPYGLVGWLWFLGTLVPVIGLVQVGGAALADRYSYFPSIGIFLALALGAGAAAGKFQLPKAVSALAAGAALSACLFLSHRQLNFWSDDVALFTHALAVTKDNATARLNLGVALEADGRKADAMAEYRAAVKLDPDSAIAHNNLANLLDDAGRPDEAMAEYRTALRLNPGFELAHDNFGTLLVELGRFDEALQQYAEAARLAPDDWHPPYLSGKALLKQGRDVEAIPYLRKALQLAPNELHLLTYFAEVLASDENPAVRDGNLALTLASRANALSGGAEPVMLDTLAMADAELGRFADAQQAEQDALRLAENYHQTNDAPVLRQRLELYKNRQPFRQSFTNAPAAELPNR
jgi:tetratricopeptide (TPR) repeat protein